jgi:GH24 family phage-related lysozyme (muramidase)
VLRICLITLVLIFVLQGVFKVAEIPLPTGPKPPRSLGFSGLLSPSSGKRIQSPLEGEMALLREAARIGARDNMVTIDPSIPQGGVLEAAQNIPADQLVMYKEYIKSKEGAPILKARKPTDSGDKFTVGYGHTTGVTEGMEITEGQADEFLDEDTAIRLTEIKKKIPSFDNFPLSVQIPLMYSWYRGSLGQSPLTRKLINEGKFKEAAEEFVDNQEYRDAKKEGSKRKGIIKKDFHALRDALLSLSSRQKNTKGRSK